MDSEAEFATFFPRFSDGILLSILECSAESDIIRRKHGERLTFPDKSILFKAPASHGIETHLKKAFGVENLEGLDLQWEAEHFFLKIGVSAETLEAVKKESPIK